MPRRPFKKKKSSRGTNPFDDSAGSLSLGDPSDAADNAQEETLGLKLHDSSKLNDTITSGSSEEDDDNDGNVNMRERLGSGDQQVEEEYGFSSIAGNGRGGGGGRTTADIAEGLDTLDDALDDLDTEPLERGNKKRGSGRFSFLNTSNWTHPKYCWRRQAMSRMGKSHMKNGLGHDERKVRRKMLLIVTAVVLVILAALAGSIAAWQVITKKNSEQQKVQDTGSGGGDGAIVIIPGGEDDLTPVVIEDDPSANATTINNTTIELELELELDLEEDFDPALNEVGEDGNGIQVDCAKCEESCRPCLGCVDLFGTTEDCDQCEPCQVCMPCFSDGGADEPESATTVVEMSYLQSYTGIDLATLATEDQIDDFQDLMAGLLDEYIERYIKDAIEVVCTYNTQRLTSNARRYRKHAGGASFRRMLRGRHLDTHGDSQQDGLDAELQSLGLEKGASPHTHVVGDDTTPDPSNTTAVVVDEEEVETTIEAPSNTTAVVEEKEMEEPESEVATNSTAVEEEEAPTNTTVVAEEEIPEPEVGTNSTVVSELEPEAEAPSNATTTALLRDECDIDSGEKWCDTTGECYKEWQTICPTSASCSTDGDCLIRIGGCGPYACQCVLLGIDESPPVECSPDDSEPCMCAGCMEETCADVRAVCLEGVCAKKVMEVSVDTSDSPTVEGPTPSPTMETLEVLNMTDAPTDERPTLEPTLRPTLALQDECDIDSGEKWCDATGECYKEWQTICPTSASCATDGDCLIRIGGCGPYACQCVLLGIDESPPVECSPDDSEPCMCAGCMEETCADVRAVCLEGVCAKEVMEVSVDTSDSPTVEGPTPSPTMEVLNMTEAPTDERPTSLPTNQPEDTPTEDLIMSEGESMKLEVDFTMAWIVSPDADQAVLDELPSIPNKFELWMNSDKGKKQIVRKFERKLDLIIEEVSDLTPRGVEDEQ